jgi:hypothetical protein
MNEDDLRKAFMNEVEKRPEEFRGDIELGQSCYGRMWTPQEIELLKTRLKPERSLRKVNNDT